ncbi:hypothetical protein HMPREF1487_04334 [Pseudomonas sp. HPB0071]|uniref:NUMOD4 domain-containing protein n=1 Tax=unclassified Pseudomonas TaxID=196821 RepID=UPI0002C8D1CE|nr:MULTISPECIES: NUMOD4 domain-containing protein [unclassified Pseudomonas]ENA37416.1 hypothetical protein HMPREF1487_04334 [Pseudomonas sp. HPB0071]
MQEVWKPITSLESSYEVSNLGRVRSLDRFVNNRWGTDKKRFIPGKLKAFSRNNQGYCSVHLYSGQIMHKFYVHRLVAMAFISNPLSLPQVNHLDGNKENNAASNLAWCTAVENCRHAVTAKLYESVRGEAVNSAVLTEAQVIEIRRMASEGSYHKDIAAIFGVGRKAITKIVNRQRWAHVS